MMAARGRGEPVAVDTAQGPTIADLGEAKRPRPGDAVEAKPVHLALDRLARREVPLLLRVAGVAGGHHPHIPAAVGVAAGDNGCEAATGAGALEAVSVGLAGEGCDHPPAAVVDAGVLQPAVVERVRTSTAAGQPNQPWQDLAVDCELAGLHTERVLVDRHHLGVVDDCNDLRDKGWEI